MFDLDDNKSGIFVRANGRTQQSRSQLRWPRDRQRSSRDAKMNGNASYFHLPLLLAKPFLPTVCGKSESQVFAKILHPHLCVGEDGEGMEQGFSVAGQDLLFASIILLSDFFWTLYCCSRMLMAPLRPEVVRRETGHMGIFPKQYLRSATDDWMMEKIRHSTSKHTLWRTDYSEPSVFTEGSLVWKPLIKGNMVEKFPPDGIGTSPHHSDLTSHFTRRFRITHSHYSHSHHSSLTPRISPHHSDLASHITHINHISLCTCPFSCQTQSLMILEGHFHARDNIDDIGVLFFVADGIFGEIRMLM